MQALTIFDTIECNNFRNPLIGADDKLNAADEDLVRMAVSCAANEADKTRRALNEQLLLEDDFWRGLIE